MNKKIRIKEISENYRSLLCGKVLTFCFLILYLTIQTSPAQNVSRQRTTAPQSNKLEKEEIKTAEQQLSDLGYWTGEIDGSFDVATRQALIAFQKAERRKPTGVLTQEECAAISQAKPIVPRENTHAHFEVDLKRQILFLVDDKGVVSHILPISSGSGKDFTSQGWTRSAVTPVGRFKVYNKIKGWRESPLGLLYYPNYIVGGIAIHGNPSVPTRPASHGCIRIPMFAAVELSRLLPIGTEVLVYESDSTDIVP